MLMWGEQGDVRVGDGKSAPLPAFRDEVLSDCRQHDTHELIDVHNLCAVKGVLHVVAIDHGSDDELATTLGDADRELVRFNPLVKPDRQGEVIVVVGSRVHDHDFGGVHGSSGAAIIRQLFE